MRAKIGNTRTRIICGTNSRWITKNTKSTKPRWPKKWARCNQKAGPAKAVRKTNTGDQYMSLRPIKRLIKSKPTLEGAGVHLRRAFGFGNTTEFDPFLLLDDFRNEKPEDYLKGFPWHPHRGIETITYVLAGTVDHGDSMGNRGAIASGDV